MATLEQTNKNLDNLTKTVNTYRQVFNGATKDIIGGAIYAGTSIEDLRDKINDMYDELVTLDKMKVSLDINDNNQIEGFIDKVKELDKQLNSMTNRLKGSLSVLNESYAAQFKNPETGETGEFKKDANELVNQLRSAKGNPGFKEVAPKLYNYIDEFTSFVDGIESKMGDLTEFGAVRSDIDKALGFNIEQSDVIQKIEEAKKDKADIQQAIKDGIASEADNIDQLNSLDIQIKRLEGLVGKRVTGYIDLYKQLYEAYNKALDKSELINIASSADGRSYYEGLAAEKGQKINWDTVSLNKIDALDSGEDIDLISDTNEELEEINNNINKSVEGISDLKEELNSLAASTNVLNQETKEGILGANYSSTVKVLRMGIDYVKKEIDDLANTAISYDKEAVIDFSSEKQVDNLNSYKESIKEALDLLDNLNEQTNKSFANLSDKRKAVTVNSAYNSSKLDIIKSVLGSGYRASLSEGTSAYDDYNKLKSGLDSLKEKAKNFNIVDISDEDLETLAKTKKLKEEISKETKKQSDIAKTLANADKERENYLSAQKKLLEAQANIAALKSNKRILLSKASSTKKVEYVSGYDKNNKPIISTRSEKNDIIDRYDAQIDRENQRIGIIKESIREIEENFKQAEITLPVVPEIEVKDSLSGQFAEDINKVKEIISQDFDKIVSDSISQILKETKSYVGRQETLTNTKMPYAEQYKYYDKQLANFKEGTDEYLEVLALRNKAENGAKEQSRKAAEDFDKIIEDVNRSELEAVNAARSRVNSILSTVKSLADGINSAVNKIVQIIRSGISIINKILSSATRFIVTIGQGVRGIIALFGNLGNRVRQSLTGVESSGSKVTNTFNLIAGSATELRSKILLLKGGFDSLFNNSLVKRAKNLMASVYSLKNIAGPKTTQEVIDWANSMEYAFGLSARGLIGDINELTGVLYGLGMSAKDTAIGSENILMMSRYLAFMGAAGGNASAVMEKLVSGMKGMTQAIDDLGLSVRDPQMDEFLKNLKKQGGEFAGIATDFSSLNEQARVYVRYASLIDQFTRNYDITNFTEALHSEIGSLQILSERVNSLLDTLGTGITKLLSKLAVYIIPVVSLIEQLITKLFSLIGIDTNLNINLNGSTEALGGLSGGLDDTKNKLDEVSESAKKAGGNLQSFDRINNVTSSSKSGASGADDFDYSKLMASALDELNKLAKEATVSYTDGLLAEFKNKLKQIKDELVQFSKDITGRADFNLGFDWKKISTNLKNIYNNIVYTLKRWGKFVIEISLKVVDDLNIGLIITKLTELLAVISQLVSTITIALIPAFREFYDIALSPIVKYIGEQFVKAIDFIIQELSKWGYWFIENKENIIKFFRDLAEIVNAAWEVVRPFLDLGWEKLGSLISNFGDKLRESLNGLMADTGNEKSGTIAWIQTELPGIINGAITKVKELWGALNGDVSDETEGTTWGEFLQILANLHDIIIALQPIIGQLLTDLLDFVKTDVLPWLNKELSKFGDWLKDNKDDIISLIEKIAGTTWDGFKLFVDLLGKLVDYVVNNPDSVKHFFEGLIGLKVSSWCVSTAAGIGTLITGLKGLSGFSGLLGGLTGGGAAAGAAGAAAAGAAGAAGAGGAAAGGGLLGGLSAGPILAVVAAIAALALAIKDLWDTSEEFRTNIKGVWDDITGTFRTAITKIKETFSGLKEAFGKLKEAYETSGLKELIGGIVTLIVEGFGGAITNLLTLLGQLVTTVINLITDVINFLSGLWKFAEGIKKVIIGIFTLDPDKILEGIGLVVDGFILAFQGLVNGLVDLFGGIITLILQVGSNLVGGLLDGIVGAWDNLVQGVKEFINNFINKVKEFLGLDGKSEGKSFKDIGQGIIDSIKSGILGAWNTFSDWISKKFEGLVTKVTDTLGKIKDKIRGIFSDSDKEADTEVKGLDERITDKSNTIKRTFTVGKNTFTSTTKANTARRVTGRAGTISRHANGGSIAGGQLFIANENGGAELIGNIDGTGKTNVANNNMIIQAMSSGIFEAVYNAMAEVLNQRNNTGNTGNTTIRLDGFGLIDPNTLRELARILAPYLKSNDINIADTQFSI